MQRSHEAIRRLLSGLARARLRSAAAVAGLWLVAALLGGMALAVLSAQVGMVRAAPAAASVVTLAALVAGAIWLRRAASPLGRPVQGGAWLAESLVGSLGSSPSCAIDLAASLDHGDVHFSRRLAEAHIDETVTALRSVDLDAALRRHHARARRRSAIAVGVATVTLAFVLILAPAGRARLASWLFDPETARRSSVPLVGDIRITYDFPAYTGLPRRVVEGGDGSIQAIVGTAVSLSARSDTQVVSGLLRLHDLADPDATATDIPLAVSEHRHLTARLSVLRDARYRLLLVTTDGEQLEDSLEHAIHAKPDTYPEVTLEKPASDLELRDGDALRIVWDARDDFGVSEVFLVLEAQGGGREPVRRKLAGAEDTQPRRAATATVAVFELGLAPGQSASVYVEAYDNDAVAGPKRGVSRARRVVVFSAQQQHEDLLGKQAELLDLLVDWLAHELEHRFPLNVRDEAALRGALEQQRAIVARMRQVASSIDALVTRLRDDKLSGPEVGEAFANVLEHVRTALAARENALLRAISAPPVKGRALAALQASQVGQLEKDIIYVDDLLAIERIDALKQTAKELLAAQRDLRSLLERFRNTQDAKLREALEAAVADLRERMFALLRKMSQIKQQLPGEYRNMEAGTMLRIDDQMQRLAELLEKGEFEQAASELEQLANVIENMVESIDRAEQEYGGERYAEIRAQLREFAARFEQLESEQNEITERTDDMRKEYRKRALATLEHDLDRFVAAAREQAQQAVARLEDWPQELSERSTEVHRQRALRRLLDVDMLLGQQDFAEALQQTQGSIEAVASLQRGLREAHDREPQPLAKQEGSAARAVAAAKQHTQALYDMLKRLFPEPSTLLPAETMQQMRAMGAKQHSLQQQATQLEAQMQQLAEQLPLFGGEPRDALQTARGHMGDASTSLDEGALVPGARSATRASERLAMLRKALQQASRRGGGGLPLPLGVAAGRHGEGDGGRHGINRDDIEIPESDPQRARPEFRKELLEAAKQKAPQRYEDAVRWYYDQLLR